MNGIAMFALCGCVSLLDAPVDPVADHRQPVEMQANVQTVSDRLDCAKAETQTDMTLCAGQDFEVADKALNSQYRVTRATMVGQAGAEDALVKAQRAWVSYRYAQCASVGFQVRGGTMEPMLLAKCKAELSRERTEALKTLADGVGN